MDLKLELMALEERFWEASSMARSDLIREYLTPDGLTVGAFGVLDRESTVQAATGQPPFEFWRIEDEPRLVELGDDCAVVVYRTTAKRAGRKAFSALMSSTYVRRDGRWRLAFHHQTSLDRR